jgi:hypothetical protein
MIDVDLKTPEQIAFCCDQGLDFINNTEQAIRAFVARFLPSEFQDLTYGYQLSGTAGMALKKHKGDTAPRVIDPTVGKFHLFFGTTPSTADEIKSWLTDTRCDVDTAVNADVQPHYIGVQFEDTAGNVVADPFYQQRWGIIEGKHDTLSLKIEERETDIFDYVDGRAQKTVRREKSYVSGVGNKQRVTPVGTAKRYSGLGWRERLALMKAGDVNVTLLEVTMGIARELHARYDGSVPVAVKRSNMDLVYDAIESAPGARSPADTKTHKRRAWDLFVGALRLVTARAEEAERARSVRIAPLHPDTRISLTEAEEKRDEILTQWFDWAIGRDKAKKDNEMAEDAWLAAGSPMHASRTALPYKINLQACPPRFIVIGDPGLGKTQNALRKFLTSGAYLTHRLFWYVPTHDKAEELKETFLKIARELGIEQPNCVAFKGFDLLCKADKARKEVASEAAKYGISPKKTACVECKLKKTCEWIRLEDEIGPGLKIGVHAHIGTATPTVNNVRITAGDAPEKETEEKAAPQKDALTRDEWIEAKANFGTVAASEDASDKKAPKKEKPKKEEPEPAPILGYVIDESYEEELDHDAVLGRSDIPPIQLIQSEKMSFEVTLKLNDILPAVRSVFDMLGPVAFAPFEAAGAFNSAMDPDLPSKRYIDVLCEQTYDAAYDCRREAAKEIKANLKRRRSTDVPRLLKKANELSALYDFF